MEAANEEGAEEERKGPGPWVGAHALSGTGAI